jgi:hypothetical protein
LRDQSGRDGKNRHEHQKHFACHVYHPLS